MSRKIFIGQRVSNENWDTLVEDTKKICGVINNLKCKTYSTLELKNNSFKKSSDWLFHAFKEIDKSDVFLAIVKSEKWSEGLLMEVGYVIAKKKEFILAIKKGVKNTYLREIAHKSIEFENIEDLTNKLRKLKL